jgi:hypothetical protein
MTKKKSKNAFVNKKKIIHIGEMSLWIRLGLKEFKDIWIMKIKGMD